MEKNLICVGTPESDNDFLEKYVHDFLRFPNPWGSRPTKVIYNNPATIVYWDDGTKTVVKCNPDDTFDPKLGFLMCAFYRLTGTSHKGGSKLLETLVEAYQNTKTWKAE